MWQTRVTRDSHCWQLGENELPQFGSAESGRREEDKRGHTVDLYTKRFSSTTKTIYFSIYNGREVPKAWKCGRWLPSLKRSGTDPVFCSDCAARVRLRWSSKSFQTSPSLWLLAPPPDVNIFHGWTIPKLRLLVTFQHYRNTMSHYATHNSHLPLPTHSTARHYTVHYLQYQHILALHL